MFGVIKRELRRRSAIEAVIGHMKTDGHLGRCYLKGRAGDAANAILTAVGYNFRRVLAWLRALLRQILIEIFRAFIAFFENHGLLQIVKPSEVRKSRMELLKTLFEWNYRVDPVRLVENNEEPELGVKPAGRVLER